VVLALVAGPAWGEQAGAGSGALVRAETDVAGAEWSVRRDEAVSAPEGVREPQERGGVTVPCPPGGIPEGESNCGQPVDTVNGGCNSFLRPFTMAFCGLTWCGTSFFNGLDRDTDWYELTLLTRQQVTFTVTAEFRVVAGLISGTNGTPDCMLAGLINPFAIRNPGEAATVTVCLNPGTWWFVVAPDFNGPAFPCGAKYTASFSCSSPCPGGACCLPNNSCQFSAGGQQACLQLGGRYQGDGTTCGAASCQAPANDLCINAVQVGCGSVGSADLRNATLSAPEPQPSCSALGVGSVWYRITGTGQPISVSACSADLSDPLALDCILTAYVGTCGGTLTETACSFQGCGPTNRLASICFPTNVGQTYYIQVQAATNAARAVYQLQFTCGCVPLINGACCLESGGCTDTTEFTCGFIGGLWRGLGTECAVVGVDCPMQKAPENDDCSTAQALAIGASVTGSTLFAQPDPALPDCGLQSPAPGVWYTVVGNGKRLTASLCHPETNFDTRITVLCNGCDGGPFTCVATNEDGPGPCVLSSEVSWCSEQGRTYYIFVHGFESQQGNFRISIQTGADACSPAAFCGAVCAVVCPPGSVSENEPVCDVGFVDTVNGGCGTAAQAFGTIAVNSTICGTSGTFATATGGRGRDTDWFRFTLTARSQVTWSVESEFLVQAIILTNVCGFQQQVLAVATGNACQAANATVTLDPGTYLAFVSPEHFQGVPCGSAWKGTLTATPTPENGACCFPACIGCVITTQEFCVPAGGLAFFGAGSTCAGLNCNPCAADFNGDLMVNGADLSVLLFAFGNTAAGDANCDGLTNAADLSVLLATFGRDCTQPQ